MKAIILLSGGLDSLVMLALAHELGRSCYGLTFDYQQRHVQEIACAEQIAQHYGIPQQTIKLDVPAFKTSRLLSQEKLPQGRTTAEIASGGIPPSYVPGRNALFLSYALGQAELLQAEEIYFGCNALDYTPYVDCRPAFIEAFQSLLNVATKQAVEGAAPRLITPLIHMDKQQIIKKGIALKVPFELSWSCYSPTQSGKPCQTCDACRLRAEGFALV